MDSCSTERKAESTNDAGLRSNQYAELFSIESNLHFSKLVIKNPWREGEVLGKYYIIKDSLALNLDTLTDGILIRTPIRSVLPWSGSQIGMMSILELQNAISAVGEFDYVYDSVLRSMMSKGQIAEVGPDHSFDLEKLVSLKPDLVFYSGSDQPSPYLERLELAGIVTVPVVEWMEDTPLARAEWLKFMSVFFGSEDEADRLFRNIEDEYNQAKLLAETISAPKQVLINAPYKGIWYMPGGKSYMASLLADANLEFPWNDGTGKGSIPLNTENVLSGALDSDIWINAGIARKRAELLSIDSRLENFLPMQSGNIYNHTRRALSSGANDYWESGVVYPNLILKDLIKIAHPDLLSHYDLTYYEKLD